MCYQFVTGVPRLFVERRGMPAISRYRQGGMDCVGGTVSPARYVIPVTYLVMKQV